MLKNAKSLEGYELRARDGAIGTVKDIYFDDERWHVRYFVVETGAWLTGRRVLISPTAVAAPRWEQHALATGLSQEQVRNSPDIDTDRPVSRQQEAELHRYYAWPHYWAAPALGTGYAAPIAPVVAPPAAALRSLNQPDAAALAAQERSGSGGAAEASETAKGDPHLRSAQVVRGYHVEATNGSIGHVEDFLIDDATWAMRYLLVDTRNWWPGKKVLVPLASIREIDWPSSTLRVDLTREAIKTGPEFDESRPVASDYTDRLEAHYGHMRGAGSSRRSR